MDEKTDRKKNAKRHVKQKHVGDETANPLPDGSHPPAREDEADDA